MIKNKFFIILIGLALISSFNAKAQNDAIWLRFPQISPDGSKIAFSYKGDIFTVGVNGGNAKQITTNTAYDTKPIWSPDGNILAFTSDRDGGMNIYTVSANGGMSKRLTFHSNAEEALTFTPDGKNIIFSANIMPDIKYSQFPSSSQTYMIPLEGGRPQMLMTYDIYEPSFSSDGSKLLYHDKKGYEDNWRKHHTSSVCRDIWEYNMNDGSIRRITNKEVEDRNPIYSHDGNKIYFLSERFGSFNVCSMDADGNNVQQLTKFTTNPVRFLSKSKDDALCFTYDGAIYTMTPGQEAKRISVNVNIDENPNQIGKFSANSGAYEFAISANGKEYAFIISGNVYVANTEFGVTKRITNTPERERGLDFAPDGRSIVYASERNGQWQIFTATIGKNDKSFAYADEINEKQLTSGDEACFQPSYSPDGKRIAYLANRTEIRVINANGGQAKTILPAKYNYSYQDGDQWFEWSPDGEWILAQYFEEGGWQHTDVALIKSDGSGEIHNLTHSGYNDVHPKWMMNGKVIIYASDKAGMRSHGSWGAQYDEYAMFLDEDAWQEFSRNREESAFAKSLMDEQKKREQEEKAKEEAKAKELAEKDNKTKKEVKQEVKANTTPAPKMKINFDNLDNRIVRLTANSSSLGDAYMSPDGTKLFYFASFESGSDLWVRDLKNGSTRLVTKGIGGNIMTDKNGGTYIGIGGRLNKFDLNSGRPSSYSFTADIEEDKAGERAFILSHAWQQVKDKFYDPTIRNMDWAAYKADYAKFLPHINNNYDFADCLGEMLGELNASHTGARFGGYASRRPTATLGAFYDQSYKGDGLKIQEILKDGPLDNGDKHLKEGSVILAINDSLIKAGKDYFAYLENCVGKRIKLTVKSGAGKADVYVKPIANERGLLYKRWVKQREELCDKLSNGRIGYIHIQAMDSKSFRDTYDKALGKYRDREALIIDTRHNGGGWLHEDLINLLTGKKFATFIPRGQFIGSDPFTQWCKPSSVLICEDNYSNAHGFPWVYKELKVGKLVGMPVPGTMTAVWWEQQPEEPIVFGIPQVGMKDNQGRYLENLQLEPDVKVSNDQTSMINGEDKQLEAAVKDMLQQLDSAK